LRVAGAGVRNGRFWAACPSLVVGLGAAFIVKWHLIILCIIWPSLLVFELGILAELTISMFF
jgi:hypothetical protein